MLSLAILLKIHFKGLKEDVFIFNESKRLHSKGRKDIENGNCDAGVTI